MNELHKAYAVLGLDPGSSMESIMRRYKRLIMVWHPDRAPTPDHKEFAEEELKKINNAKDVLTKHFGASGGHRATGCDCQAGAGAAAGTGTRSSSSGSAGPGPGPNYHRSKTADDKYQEEQAAKKRDAERKAREEAEANARRQQEQYTQHATQQTMESAMKQQAALQDEKLRWQISIGLIIAFVVLEIFGTMAIGAKAWWKDMSWKWQHSTQTDPTPINNNLEEGQSGLKYAQEKLARLTGETPPAQTAPSLVSPITGNNQSVPLIPSNSSPFAEPADPNSTLLTPSTTPSFFKPKGFDGLSTPTPSLSELMKKYKSDQQTAPSTSTGGP